jgi:cytochrome b involved in lipid metabolism
MNKQKISIAVIIALVALLIVAISLKPKNENLNSTSEQATSTDTAKINSPATSSVSNSTKVTVDSRNFTLAEVSKHTTDTDCYSTIDGVVYDLSAWVYQHPGGDRNILKICGIDGSGAFNNKHGNNQNVKNVLAGFEIGVLIK